MINLHTYDHIILFFSGGKDSLACLLHLLDSGADPAKLQLWHHLIDGPADRLMDWPSLFLSRWLSRAGHPIALDPARRRLWRPDRPDLTISLSLHSIRKQQLMINNKHSPSAATHPQHYIVAINSLGHPHDPFAIYPKVRPDTQDYPPFWQSHPPHSQTLHNWIFALESGAYTQCYLQTNQK